MDRKDVVIGCLGLLLAGTAAGGFLKWRSWDRHTQELEQQIKELQLKEKRSAVDRSVSKQMEEIAYAQQALSEEHRIEAVEQSQIAQEMTRRSEIESQNALKAQKYAEASAEEARSAQLLAENQRQIAEQQRSQAEYSKRVADTLNYISLSHALGNQAYTLYRTGDTEIGNMLAYTSFLFSRDYKGDLYAASVFQALSQSSKGKQDWSIHNGDISCVNYFPGKKRMLTTSTYGEIFSHEKQGDQLYTKQLFVDRNYDFRDAYPSSNDKCYAISKTGHLVIVKPTKSEVVTLDKIDHPFKIVLGKDESQLYIVGEHSLGLFDANTDELLDVRQLDYRITCASKVDYKPLLFDDKGRMHVVNSLHDFTTSKVPVPGRVTAFASSKNEHLAAYGTQDGNIYLVGQNGQVNQLKGHLSQVTKMKFNGKRLYSSSYDGKLLFWPLYDEHIKPITLFQTDNWILNFNYDSAKEFIWAGLAKGTLSECLISIDLIQDRIRKSLKRDFTKEEWNYYVGKGIPYQSIINQQ